MSLYACALCDTIDNTALTNFHEQAWKHLPVLCSVCDPEIGCWHGQFQKRRYTEADYQLCPDYEGEAAFKRVLCPKPYGYDYCKHSKG